MEQETRNQILNKATELFSKQGFHVVSVDQVIEGTGVSLPALYGYFPNKDELVRAVLKKRYTDILVSIEQTLKSIPDPVGKIKGIFDWYGAWFRTPEFCGCLFERALSEFGTDTAGISDVAIGYKRTLEGRMADILRTVLPHSRAEQLAETYAMFLDGAIAAARAYGDPEVANHAWQSAQALLDEARRHA